MDIWHKCKFCGRKTFNQVGDIWACPDCYFDDLEKRLDEYGEIKRAKTFKMKVVCCVCGVQYNEKDSKIPDQVSHGYCPECKELILMDMESQFDKREISLDNHITII